MAARAWVSLRSRAAVVLLKGADEGRVEHFGDAPFAEGTATWRYGCAEQVQNRSERIPNASASSGTVLLLAALARRRAIADPALRPYGGQRMRTLSESPTQPLAYCLRFRLRYDRGRRVALQQRRPRRRTSYVDAFPLPSLSSTTQRQTRRRTWSPATTGRTR